MSIIIVGGGFGGLEAAFTLQGLLGKRAEITLIDRSVFHSFIPSIHEIISGKITARNIQVPLETVLSPLGVRFLHDNVTAIDPGRRQVITAGRTLNYDYLLLATGAENNFFGIPGAEECSHRFRSPEDAGRIHEDLVKALAERKETHIAIAGGGTEGVEVAGEVLDLLDDGGHLDDLLHHRITVTIVESRDLILPGFPREASDAARQYLEARGVRIAAGFRISAVHPTVIRSSSGRETPFTILIWSGGIRPSRLIESLPLSKDADGWLTVTGGLQTLSDDRIYAVGDAISLPAQNRTHPSPLRLAYHAKDQAVIAGLNIARRILGGTPLFYTPRNKPRLLSIGRNEGLFVRGEQAWSGAWVISAKKAVERAHLMSCLTRPALAWLPFTIPGAGLIQRAKLNLPFP